MDDISRGKYLKLLEATECTLLRDIKRDSVVDIYGIITSYKPPTKTRGADHVCSLMIADPSRGLQHMSDTSVNLFHQNPEGLPLIREKGEILVLKKARVQSFLQKLQCVSAKGYTAWAVIPVNGTEPVHLPGMNLSLDDKDFQVIKILQDWFRAVTGNTNSTFVTKPQAVVCTPPVSALVFSDPKRLLTIAEIKRPRMFADLIAEVVAFYRDTERNMSQLLLVDYTTNDLLEDHQVDRFGVAGRRVIMCTIYDEHHKYCPSLEIGHFVFVRNVNSKMDRNNCLELRMNGDRSKTVNHSGVRLVERNDPRLVPLLERRQEYVLTQRGREAQKKPVVDSKTRVWTVTKHKNAKTVPLSSVVSSTMAVDKFKVRACVVNYKPSSINDMARPWCSKCNQSSSPSKSPDVSCSNCKAPISQYKYQFACLLQDVEGIQLPVIFHDTDAEHFLSNLAPSNLYTDEDTSSDLQMQIQAMCPAGKSSNVWLDFCVQSYEVDINGEKDRRFRIFDTELKMH